MPEIRPTLRSFLAGFIRANTLTDATDIFEAGFVNSMFAMQLLLFIEKTYALSVANDELDLANFRSVDAMANFILRKQAQEAAA